jgi:hypothetical protein
MFSNMRAAVGLQRAKSLRTDVYPTVADVLRMATLGGAEALDLADRIGSLTPGKKADLIIVDPSGVNFAPRFDWLSQLVFNTQPSNVTFVFVNGRALKANGQSVGVAPAAVVKAAEESSAACGKPYGRRVRRNPIGEDDKESKNEETVPRIIHVANRIYSRISSPDLSLYTSLKRSLRWKTN